MLLIAYSANLLGRLKNDSVLFLITNILGAGLLVVNAYVNEAYPFVIVNLFWFLVSLVQLMRLKTGRAGGHP